MANVPQVVPLALEAATTTANAGLRPFRAGLEINLKEISLGGLVKNFITLYSNAGNDAGHLGILNPLSPIFDQEPLIRDAAVQAFGTYAIGTQTHGGYEV
jgi:hypothetical protein